LEWVVFASSAHESCGIPLRISLEEFHCLDWVKHGNYVPDAANYCKKEKQHNDVVNAIIALASICGHCR
jgi:hypothetical protein